jgi:hypothetical protein
VAEDPQYEVMASTEQTEPAETGTEGAAAAEEAAPAAEATTEEVAE